MINLTTDASFCTYAGRCDIGMAAVVRDDARVVSRVAAAYSDPAHRHGVGISGETSHIAELRAALFGFEHLVSLLSQGWVWSCARVSYFTDCQDTEQRLKRLRAGEMFGHGEVAEVLHLIKAAWKRAGIRDLGIRRLSFNQSRDILDCDLRSKVTRRAWNDDRMKRAR